MTFAEAGFGEFDGAVVPYGTDLDSSRKASTSNYLDWRPTIWTPSNSSPDFRSLTFELAGLTTENSPPKHERLRSLKSVAGDLEDYIKRAARNKQDVDPTTLISSVAAPSALLVFFPQTRYEKLHCSEKDPRRDISDLQARKPTVK